MKMSRRKLRESIFLLLFRIEFNTREELDEQMRMYIDSKTDMDEEDADYICKKLEDILDHLTELDETILKICKGWRL